MTLLGTLLEELDREMELAVELRHRLHANPEIAHNEHWTSATIAEALPVESTVVAGTGRLARVISGRGRAVAVRAELDGLPVKELTDAEFKSENGAMHACGHDVHMAALVALTRAAQRLGNLIPVDLVAIFQPSEEADPSGARMLAEGELQELDLDAAIGVHVHPELGWGVIALDSGTINASADTVEIIVKGESTHSGYPHRGKDPVLALSMIVVDLHAQLGRVIDPLNPGVITVGTLEAGTTENVIPASARATATIRAFQSDDREALARLVTRIATSVATAHECKVSVDLRRGEPALTNDERIIEAAVSMLPTDLNRSPSWRSCGADDFSFLTSICPIALGFVGLNGYPGFKNRPLHHPELLVPDAAVRQVTRALAVLFCAAALDPHEV